MKRLKPQRLPKSRKEAFKRMLAIIKKELKSYFTSVIGYILLAGFVFTNGLFFSMYNVGGLYPDYSYVLGITSIIFLIMIPILTMRLFAEETRQKTDQLLYTSPLKIGYVVAGKYLSALSFLLAAMLLTALFPFALSFFGPLPYAKTIACMTGYFLLGGAFISAGMFVSVLTDNQIVAAFGSFLFLFMLYSLYGLIAIVPADTASSVIFTGIMWLGFCFVLYNATKNIYAGIIAAILGAAAIGTALYINPVIFDGTISKFLGWFSLMARFDNFYQGILNLSDIVYYITFSAAFIYLTVNVIEKRRWR
jgi:ABC-2 type transport system permease protein